MRTLLQQQNTQKMKMRNTKSYIFGQNDIRAKKSFGEAGTKFGRQSMLSMISRDSHGTMLSDTSQSNRGVAQQDLLPEDEANAQGHQNNMQYDGDSEIETKDMDIETTQRGRGNTISKVSQNVQVGLEDLETFDQNEFFEENPNFDE